MSVTEQSNEAEQQPEYPYTEHAAMVATVAKRGADILAQLTPESVHIWHMATGVSSEAGELLDAVKKVVCYNKPVDIENVIEELGDLEFYMEGLRNKLGITRERTLVANMTKLAKRYADFKYSDAAAAERADKKETGQVDLPHSLANEVHRSGVEAGETRAPE